MKFKIICEIDEEALNNINEAILGCLNSRLKNAKEKFLKKNVSIQDKFSIYLDTNLVAEYA